MHVTGSTSPYGYLQSTKAYVTSDVSALIKQDVLLLAGIEVHLVPLEHFYRQIEMLKNVRSMATRLFTKSDHAQSHCQVGNYGVAFKTIVDWLEGLREQEPGT